MTNKKTPLRMCVGCRQMREKAQLLRIVRQKDGTVLPDLTGKASGRGAYICKSGECLKKAEKTGALSRALNTAVDKGVYDSLEEALSSLEQ